ncbi:MAG: hypothetical protein ABL955_02510 [Elusimicrobiota bacterium]
MAMMVSLTAVLVLFSAPSRAQSPQQPETKSRASHSPNSTSASKYSTESLIARLKSGSFLNDDAPLYDMKDPRILSAYNQAVKQTPPHVIFRDTSSWEEIEGAVTEHLRKHGSGALVVISGSATHIYGAIPHLEKTSAIRYISATPIKLSIAAVQRDGASMDKSEGKALSDIKVQMGRNIGALKILGYHNIQSFLADRAKVYAAKNIVVGVEETGLHTVYDRGSWEDKAEIYTALKAFVAQAKPTSVLYIEESLNVPEKQADYAEPGMKRFLDGEKWQKKEFGFPRRPWDDFLIDTKNKGIPVAFAAFGLRADKQPQPEFERALRLDKADLKKALQTGSANKP